MRNLRAVKPNRLEVLFNLPERGPFRWTLRWSPGPSDVLLITIPFVLMIGRFLSVRVALWLRINVPARGGGA